jgi:endonuclease G
MLNNAAYDVLYSETRRNPIYSAYCLGPVAPSFRACPRSGWITDTRVPNPVQDRDYTNTGYDRGHLAPSQGIGTRYGCAAQDETFRLTNVAPYSPRLNQGPWKSVENAVAREWANRFGGLYVLTGPIYDPNERVTLGETDIEVPLEFWKVIVRAGRDGRPEALPVVMRQDGDGASTLGAVVTTIDDIEERTGLDLFPDLPSDQEADLESQCPATDWNLSMPLSRAAGNVRPIREVRAPRTQPLASPPTRADHAPVCR